MNDDRPDDPLDDLLDDRLAVLLQDRVSDLHPDLTRRAATAIGVGAARRRRVRLAAAAAGIGVIGAAVPLLGRLGEMGTPTAADTGVAAAPTPVPATSSPQLGTGQCLDKNSIVIGEGRMPAGFLVFHIVGDPETTCVSTPMPARVHVLTLATPGWVCRRSAGVRLVCNRDADRVAITIRPARLHAQESASPDITAGTLAVGEVHGDWFATVRALEGKPRVGDVVRALRWR